MAGKGSVIPRNFKARLALADHAEGIYIYDDKGRKYIDGCSGALISSIGHGVPEVVEAIHAQMAKLSFAHSSRWLNRATEEAAEAVARISPGDLNCVWFVCGGSEAVESALKMARQYYIERDGAASLKHLVIGRWNSYHGTTLGTMAVGGNIPRRRIFLPMFKDHPKISPHYCYRCPYGWKYPECNLACAHELEDTILREGAGNIAALLIEPIVGSTVGALVPPPGYWPLVREICDRYDILLIADEIMTGIGRTGRAFCVEHWDVIPDIITSAKGLGAGYVPAGATIVREPIVAALREGSGSFQNGYTYCANPISAAAVTAVLYYIEQHHLIENADTQGRLLGELLRQIVDSPIVGELRGKGLMWGVEIVADKATKTPFKSGAGAAGLIAAECMKRGLIIYPSGGMVDGRDGDNFLIAPPLIVDSDQIREIVSILRESLEAASNTLSEGGGNGQNIH